MSLLPSGYKRLLYIESTGTQYVNTGFVSTRGWKATFEWMFTVAPSEEQDVLGGYISISGGYQREYVIARNGQWALGHASNSAYAGNAAVNVKYSISASTTSGDGYLYVNGEKLRQYTTTFNAHAAHDVYVFAMCGAGNSAECHASGRLYSLKLFDPNNVLVRNFIPCINGAGEIGLYDTVNGVFCGNSGTGVFIAGPEFWYDELEYIESSGTQWVDTNINAASGLEMYADFEFSDISGNYSVAGANSNGTRIFLAQNINGVWGYGYGSYYGGSTGAVVGEKYRIHSKLFPGSQTLKIDGATVASGTVANSYNTGLNLYLLGMNLNSAIFGAIKGKLYSCQIYDNGTLVRDFIPAKLPDGSIGLIDKLTEEFYPNMGTGTFVAGPECTKPTAPTDLSVSIDGESVLLSWTGGNNATGYYVYRNGELIATVTDTTYSEEIQPSISYTYAVTAFNDFGETEPASVEIAPSAAPPSPANLRVMFADFASAQIAWDASVGATAYRVYRDGEFLAETESRIFADSGLSKDTEYIYTVTAINVVGESSASSLMVKTSDFTLITDRTAADVEYALAQALNPDRNNTEWLKGLKGTYNATDLNRVEKAVEYVANRLEIAGWRKEPVVKIDWSFSDFPTVSEMQRYLDNIRLLRAALPDGMPAVPADMNGFTYIEANTIEQILLMLDAAVTNIMKNVFYSNEIFSGEVQ